MKKNLRKLFGLEKEKTNMNVCKIYPTVEYGNDDCLKSLEKIGIDDIRIPSIIEQIFFKLGFKVEDKILISNVKFKRDEDSDNHEYIVDCLINGISQYKITFEYEDYFSMYPMIIVSDNDKLIGYKIRFLDRKEKDIKLDMAYVKTTNENYVECCCNYSYLNTEIEISNGYYKMSLEVSRPDDVKIVSYYKLEKELELVEYLTDLDFPISIDEVYKKLCEDYLGDISKYPIFKLLITRYNLCEGKYEETDFITLIRGRWIRFGMTKDGQTVKLSNDGDWSYKMLESDSVVTFEIEDDSFSYTVSANSEEKLEHYVGAQYNISYAKNEVSKVKKLVKTMFNERSDCDE